MQGNINRLSEKDIHFLLEEHIGEKYTLYRSMWNSTTVDDIPKYPIHIDFELNDKCNQSCVMCPRNAKTHPEINYVLGANTSLPFQMFKSVIDDGAPKGLMSINLGAFAELLLHKDCFEMIS